MQHRLVELIGKLANDEVTAELLRVNDELNNLFLRYVVQYFVLLSFWIMYYNGKSYILYLGVVVL